MKSGSGLITSIPTHMTRILKLGLFEIFMGYIVVMTFENGSTKTLTAEPVNCGRIRDLLSELTMPPT